MSDALASHLVFAAGAGVATFLSPCALPLVPGYIGYYTSTANGSQRAAGVLTRGLAAAVGVLVTLGALAGLAIAVGRPVTRLLPVVEPLVGLALLLFGALVVTDRAPDWRVPLPARRADTPGFALFGVGYAGASAGCVLPVFLAVVVQTITLPTPAAAAVVAVYAGAVAVPLLAVTVAVGLGLDVATGRLTDYGTHLEQAAGVVLVVAGAGQVAVAIAPAAVPTFSSVV
ncbi:cytochrome c biogenesis CcdA family protein [Salinibaculum rarum]|uniref:cytochrome c biogenesis CcdA family protein n=1 Tax=Salinibaculum rarum TaxID=3058903 RepID=UPI00265F14C0|nr:cytochrome c biogenesis protein CcdA [Salinibaculum sp. KK48]